MLLRDQQQPNQARAMERRVARTKRQPRRRHQTSTCEPGCTLMGKCGTVSPPSDRRAEIRDVVHLNVFLTILVKADSATSASLPGESICDSTHTAGASLSDDNCFEIICGDRHRAGARVAVITVHQFDHVVVQSRLPVSRKCIKDGAASVRTRCGKSRRFPRRSGIGR